MQLFVGVDQTDGPTGSVVVSFRGSEVGRAKPRHKSYDEIRVALQVLENYIQDLEAGESSGFPDCPNGCRVHSGMFHTYNSIRSRTVEAILEKLADNPGALVRATGHSMGASMVELLCVDVSLHHGVRCSTVYTYGTPRSGNQAFVDALASATLPTHDVWRVTHWRDPVPHLPPALLGYVHATTEVFYNYDFTSVRQCVGPDDKDCCQQFAAVSCLLCCVMEHLSYMNQSVGQAQRG